MSLYKIDDTIINHYLDGDDTALYKEDSVYSFGNDEARFFIEPDPHLINKARLITDGIKNIVNNLTLEKDELVLKYLGNIEQYLENIVIKLVVGLPLGYRRMFRSNDVTGELNIVIDVTNNLSDDDDVDLYLNDFEDFIKYAIILMILDTKGPTEISDTYTTLIHGIYASSFASYISRSKQLELLDNIEFIQMVESDEYRVLKDGLKKKKANSLGKYISVVIQTNPEMILLGVTGKRLLSMTDEDKCYELYKSGAEQFCMAIIESKDVKERIVLPNVIKILNRIVLLASLIFVGLAVYSIVNGFNIILKVYVLIYLGILLLKNFAENKMGLMSNKKFLIYGSIITLIAVLYIIIML